MVTGQRGTTGAIQLGPVTGGFPQPAAPRILTTSPGVKRASAAGPGQSSDGCLEDTWRRVSLTKPRSSRDRGSGTDHSQGEAEGAITRAPGCSVREILGKVGKNSGAGRSRCRVPLSLSGTKTSTTHPSKSQRSPFLTRTAIVDHQCHTAELLRTGDVLRGIRDKFPTEFQCQGSVP